MSALNPGRSRWTRRRQINNAVAAALEKIRAQKQKRHKPTHQTIPLVQTNPVLNGLETETFVNNPDSLITSISSYVEQKKDLNICVNPQSRTIANLGDGKSNYTYCIR